VVRSRKRYAADFRPVAEEAELFNPERLGQLIKKLASKSPSAKRLGAKRSKELKEKLESVGVDQQRLAEIMAMASENVYYSLMAYIGRCMRGEVNLAWNKSRAKEESEELTAWETFVKKKLGFSGAVDTVTVTPWLSSPDMAHFVTTVGKPLVKSGFLRTTRSGVAYSGRDYYSETGSVSWKEGENTVVREVPLAVELMLGGQRCALVTRYPTQAHGVSVQLLITPKGHSEQAVNELERLYFENCLFRNRVISMRVIPGGGLEFTIRSVEPKPAILEEMKQAKFDRLVKIVSNWDKLNKSDRKEGMVLYGPPGSGKTASLTQVVNRLHGKATIFYIQGVTGTLMLQLYRWLDRVGPNIVICEDMDTIQVDRQNAPASGSFVSLLLNILDGEEEFGVITIATTNFPEQLDMALIRPGRLGTSVRYDPPDRELKIRIIQFYLERLGLTETFDADELMERFFKSDLILGCHIAAVLRKTAVEVKLGVDPQAAVERVGQEYLGEENLSIKRAEASPLSRGPMGLVPNGK
jgi:hypothetical protein